MLISDIYAELLLNQYIKDQTEAGEVVSYEGLQQYTQSVIDELDLTIPQFDSEDYSVARLEESSALKTNNTLTVIRQDLRALYKSMLSLTKLSIEDFERWRMESRSLEKRLKLLEDRIDGQLLLLDDTEGYHSFLVDNFIDAEFVAPPPLSDIDLDIACSVVLMQENDDSEGRIFLDDLEDSDVAFKIRTPHDGQSQPDGTSRLNIFKQESSSWQTTVFMKKPSPVVCELVVKLDEYPVELNCIDIFSFESGDLQITPMYSIDNYNYSQLPGDVKTMKIRDSGSFHFETVEAKWVKFLLVDEVPGTPTSYGGSSAYPYEFGFKEIAFYLSDIDQAQQTLISEPRHVEDLEGNVVEFSKVALDACESVGNGNIDYYIAVSNSPLVTVDEDLLWHPISPMFREDATSPRALIIGDLTEGEVTDAEVVTDLSESFHLLSNSSGTILDETVEVDDDTRYLVSNYNERLLNYQIKNSSYVGSGTGDALEVDENSIVIYRNVGEKGLFPDDSFASTVRGIQRGWKEEGDWFSTFVEILNPLGMSIRVSDGTTTVGYPMFIDNKEYRGIVPSEALLGKTEKFDGVHHIKIHKSNWVDVPPNLSYLGGTGETLKKYDSLYPYNHKLLIEGYAYADSYSNSQEKVYTGVDRFFSHKMRKISLVDFSRNAAEDGFKFFTLDYDAPNAHTGGNDPTRIILVKADQQQADERNERFDIKFNLINQRYKYLRLKAVFSPPETVVNSLGETVSGGPPILDSYKIKLGD